MAVQLKELIINGYPVSPRAAENMDRWMSSLTSVIFPVSLKASVYRNGRWEKCILTGRLTGENPDHIELTLCFEDATTLSVRGFKTLFYTDEYLEAKREERARRTKAQKEAKGKDARDTGLRRPLRDRKSRQIPSQFSNP